MRPHISTGTSIRKRFVDTFQRSNTDSDPGVAADGSKWRTLSGTFNISNNVLNTATSASSYPVSVVEMGVQNVSLEITASGQGATAALWVTDAGNWWGVQTFSQPENCNCVDTPHDYCNTCYNNVCSTCYNYVCSTCYNYVCSTCYYGTYYCQSGTYGTYYCTAGSSYCELRINGTCVSWSYTPGPCYADSWTTCTPNSYNCNCSDVPYNCNCSNAPYNCNCSNVPYNCNCGTYYTTSCSTCYPQYFKIIKNISGTITSVWSQVIVAVAAAFRVKTSGDVITVQAYSDSGMTSQIGSDLTYTATGSTKSTKFGLAISPSSYNQTATISKISIDRN